MASGRERRERWNMMLVTIGTALVITIVLYFAGAFTRSTG